MILDQKTFLEGLELSPCPFCNERDIRIRVDLGCGIVYVECMQCHAQHSGPDKREAVANWNRRPETYRHDWQSHEWEGSKEQAEFINRQHNAVLDVLIDAGAWTSHEPWKGKTAAEQVKIFVDRALAAEKELAAVKRELHAAALWDDDSDKTTTPSVQVYVLHQKLIERADDCRVWDRRYEAAIKTLNIVTQHRNELQALCERQAQQLAAKAIENGD